MTFLFGFIRLLCEVLTILIFIRAIISWLSPSSTNIFVSVIYQITEPLLAPLRRIIPRVGMFDFTPLAAIIVLQLIANLLP